MKKVKIISLLSLSLFGCSTGNQIVKQSEIVATTKNEKVIFIRDNEIGRLIHKSWVAGVYGPAEVHLVKEEKFLKMTGDER